MQGLGTARAWHRWAATAIGAAILATLVAVFAPVVAPEPADAAPVGASATGGPVIIDGTDSGLHGSILLDGTGVPKASELRSTWIYELKAWETLLGNVPTDYVNNGKVAVVGTSYSNATSNNCGAAARYVSERLATGAVSIEYFDGTAAITQLFNDVLAGTVHYKMIQIMEQGWCQNGMDASEAAVVDARGPAIAAHVNRGGALFSQSQSYGWLNSLFPNLARSSACSGSTPNLTAAGYAQFPGLTDANIQAPWHNCFVVSSGTFPLTQLALQNGAHTVILGGDEVSLPSNIDLTTTPAQPRPGDEVCTTATVTQAGSPVQGASVEFFINGVSVATQATGADGKTTYCYTKADSGEDEITALVRSGPGSGSITETLTFSNVFLEAEPGTSQPKGGNACVTATVASSDGETTTPAVGATVHFSIEGANDAAETPVETDELGRASFCYDGVNGGTDVVTARLGSGEDADERSILMSWTGARVDVIDVEQPANGTNKVVPITVAEFDGTPTVYCSLSIPSSGAGTLSINTSGLTLTPTAPTTTFTGQTTIAFSGTLSNVTTALASRVTWAAPSSAGTDEITVHVGDAATSPTLSASDTGTLTTTAAPTILSSPSPTTVDTGGTATFTSTASGSPPPTAQWYESSDGSTWLPIAGGSDGTLTLTATDAMNGRQYKARWVNSVGFVDSAAATLTVNPVSAPSWIDQAIGTLVSGSAFTDGVSAGGQPAPTYTVVEGSLPDGLTLDSETGAITGTPTAPGGTVYSFTVEASNGIGSPVTATFSGTISSPPTWTDETIGDLQAGEAFADQVQADGSPAPTYSVSAGTLPDGLVLDPATGVIAGTPSTEGPYSFTVEASNGIGDPITTSFSGTIAPPNAAPGWVDDVIGSLQVGVAFEDAVQASGRPAPTYTVTAGALPEGLVLDAATGAITGTPTVAGTYDFTITADNGIGAPVSKQFEGLVTSGPAWTDDGLAGMQLGVTYEDGVSASGSPDPVYEVSVGSLPAGIVLDAVTGAITGTPSETGPYDFTITASNGIGDPITRQFVGTVVTGPAWVDDLLGNLQVGIAFSDGVSASGTPAPAYSVTAGALPAGLSLDETTGALTGTPTEWGPYSFTITAANGVGDPITQDFTGVVTGAAVWFDVQLDAIRAAVSYQDSVVAVGFPAPTYSVTAGALPDGLSLDAVTGAITGTPTTAGPYDFTVTADNGVGSVSQQFTGSVEEEPAIDLDLRLTIGAGIDDPASTVVVTGEGLLPASEYVVTMYSAPRELFRGIVGAEGVFTETLTLPADAEAGAHRIVVEGVGVNGVDLADEGWFTIGFAGEIQEASEEGPTGEPTQGLPEEGFLPSVTDVVPTAADDAAAVEQLAETGTTGVVPLTTGGIAWMLCGGLLLLLSIRRRRA